MVSTLFVATTIAIANLAGGLRVPSIESVETTMKIPVLYTN